MTDTDLLRRAAQVVRKTAQAATPDLCPDWAGLAVRHVARNCDLECPTHEDRYECQQWSRYDDASHMALWHRGVALVVADWLEQHAAEHDTYDCGWEDDACAALKAARALLAQEATADV